MSYERLGERIRSERERRLADQPWHYWIRSGRDCPPSQEWWCSYCAGFFGVPHSHERRRLCREMGRTNRCACIDCWVWDERVERRYSAPVLAVCSDITITGTTGA